MTSSMSIATEESPVRIVLDTNILVSAIGFGGKPRTILEMALEKKVKGITSSILLAELEDVIVKKFPELEKDLEHILQRSRRKFRIVKPKDSITVTTDEPDNRVLEAAVTGDCEYIITGDKELLALGSFKGIQIVTPQEFLLAIAS